MKFIREILSNFGMAFHAIFANKLRSALASLGVMVGISIVILMSWVLDGLDTAVTKTFEIIGNDMIYVSKWDWTGKVSWKYLRNRKNIDNEDVFQFKNQFDKAQYVIPNIDYWGITVKYKNEVYSGYSAVGATYENAFTPAGDLKEGRFYSKFEEETSKQVAVISNNIYTALFPNGDALGKFIKLDGHKYEIIGVVKKRGTFIFDFIDNQIFIPITTFKNNFGDKYRTYSIGIKAGDEKDLNYLRAETIGLMRSIRNIKPDKPNDFSINETKAFEDNIKQIRYTVWGIGLGLTALSFVVGIIGIMNIMFVSVTERTKEIGLRKALGAKNRSVILQFLIESSALTLTGSVISIMACILFINVARIVTTQNFPNYADVMEYFPPYLAASHVIIACTVSICVGMLAGLIPAIKASQLDPVEALRSE